MSKRALILVEGQTEERFVKDVLGPAFWERELFFTPTILTTKRVKEGSIFKGGVTSFAKFRNDAYRLLNSSGGALVTTMLDYYGLPSDFPGMDSRPVRSTPFQRVAHVENAIAQNFGSPTNFVPFLALHEFEAWLFSSDIELPRTLSETARRNEFGDICASVGTPEEINEHPESAPSKRILNLFPSYAKVLHGPITAKRIGLALIRSKCPHFNDWMKKLDVFASP